MKYQTKIVINAPLAEVIEKLDNPENMKHWQEELNDYKILNGLDSGARGAQTRLHYTMNGRDMVLIETVLKNNFPHSFEASYTTKGIYNIQYNHFKEITPNVTEWTGDNEFRFKGLAMKALGFIMSRTFKNQNIKFFEAFKAFVEDGTSVTNK
jgi:hypothetical protein